MIAKLHHSARSRQGKTSLLLFLLLTHLLPFSTDIPLAHGANVRIQLGGKSQPAALLYCTSQRSPIPALARAMRGHIRDCLSNIVSPQSGGGGVGGRYASVTEDGMDAVVQASLAKLRVTRVKPRYKSWALGLRSLTLPMRGWRSHEGASEEIQEQAPSLVCMDGLSKCHWTEKWADEDRSTTSVDIKGSICPPGIIPTDGVRMRDVMQAIGRLRLDMGCVIMCTTQGLWVSYQRLMVRAKSSYS